MYPYPLWYGLSCLVHMSLSITITDSWVWSILNSMLQPSDKVSHKRTKYSMTKVAEGPASLSTGPSTEKVDFKTPMFLSRLATSVLKS